MAEAPARRLWIVHPAVDLTCISAGWLLFFLLPVLSPEHTENTRVLAFTFFVAHRYFTFPLVYLDRAEFERRKVTYILVPIACLVGVWLCYIFRVDEPEMFAFWWFFNYFHFVRQKYGILRIYSGKARWGAKRLDEIVTYGWGAAGIAYMLAHQSEMEGRLMHYLAGQPEWIYAIVVLVAAWWIIDELGSTNGQSRSTVVALGAVFVVAGAGFGLMLDTPSVLRMLVNVLYGIVGVLTAVWLAHEFRAPEGPSWPKLLFGLSVVVMYGVGPLISAVVVTIATSFSHASEYIAVVGLAVKNKARTDPGEAPALTRASKHVVLWTVLFLLAVTLVLQGMKAALPFAFLVFTYGTSFMHFVFDGMIWKLRRPRVAREVGATA